MYEERRGERKRRGGGGIWEANLDISSSIGDKVRVRVEAQEEIPIREVNQKGREWRDHDEGLFYQ